MKLDAWDILLLSHTYLKEHDKELMKEIKHRFKLRREFGAAAHGELILKALLKRLAPFWSCLGITLPEYDALGLYTPEEKFIYALANGINANGRFSHLAKQDLQGIYL